MPACRSHFGTRSPGVERYRSVPDREANGFFSFNPLLLLILPRLFTLRARYSNSDHCHDRSNVIRRASIELGAILK